MELFSLLTRLVLLGVVHVSIFLVEPVWLAVDFLCRNNCRAAAGLLFPTIFPYLYWNETIRVICRDFLCVLLPIPDEISYVSY